MRSPHTTGLECPKPGIAVFQRMFLPDSTFHSIGGAPAPTPLADGPRNWGQFASVASAAKAAMASGKASEKVSKQIARIFMDASIAKKRAARLRSGVLDLPSPWFTCPPRQRSEIRREGWIKIAPCARARRSHSQLRQETRFPRPGMRLRPGRRATSPNGIAATVTTRNRPQHRAAATRTTESAAEPAPRETSGALTLRHLAAR